MYMSMPKKFQKNCESQKCKTKKIFFCSIKKLKKNNI